MAVYPITFSIPESKLVTEIPVKTKFISTIIPGDVKTYTFNTEEAYYNEYKSSIFALTTKKGGWDCMRHYEVLANGCIPYFPSIEYCPNTILALLPKKLLIEGNALYKKYKNTKFEDIDMNECKNFSQKLLDYTRRNLTTIAMAKYFIYTLNMPNIERILILNGKTNPDYLRCSLLHGLKELLGKNCHDSPKVPHIYKSNTINYTKLYGNGYSYSNLLDSSLHDEMSENTLIDDIKAMKYDIIVYGSYHRGMPHYDLVQEIYPGDKIILLCGEDTHSCRYDKYLEKGHKLFIREM